MALSNLSTLRDFFRIWFFWKTHAIVTMVTIVAVAMLFSYIVTPKYESTAKIMILPVSSDGLAAPGATDAKRVLPVSSEDINTEIELLKSKEVIEDTVRSFSNGTMELRAPKGGVFKRVAGFIARQLNEALIFLGLVERLSPFQANVRLVEKALSVEPVVLSNIIVARLRAENPRGAALVLNRLLEVYKRHHDRAYTKSESVPFFQEQTRKYKKKLLIAEKKLKEFKKEWDIVNIEKQNEASLELISDLDQELKMLEISCDEKENRIASLKNALSKSKNSSEVLITKEMRTIPVIVELEKGVVPLLVRRSEILERYTRSSREYQNIDSQIREIRGEILKEVKRAIKTDALELQSLRVKKDSLKKKLDALRKRASLLSQKITDVNELEREIELYRKNYMLYASKTEDARIFGESQKRDLANVSIVNRPTVPVMPVFPKRLLILFVSVFVGLFAAMGIPFLFEAFDSRLKTASDVAQHLDLPVICSFPEISSPRKG